VGDQSFQKKSVATIDRLEEEGRPSSSSVTPSTIWAHFWDRVLLPDRSLAQAVCPPDEVTDLFRQRVLIG